MSIPHILLFYFLKGKKSAQAVKKLRNVYTVKNRCGSYHRIGVLIFEPHTSQVWDVLFFKEISTSSVWNSIPIQSHTRISHQALATIHHWCEVAGKFFIVPCRNCLTCCQILIRARSDFPHVAAGGYMVWPGSEPHRIMIDKIIFKFCVVVVIL